MSSFNIYLIGVGGQGIGLLSNIILRSIDRSGQKVVGVDTHGLAQRGGTVQSMVRMGEVYSPLIPKGQADLVVALEVNEALRGMNSFLVQNGVLVYYDTEWQPLSTRLSKSGSIKSDQVQNESKHQNVRGVRVLIKDLPDPRMQNIALLATIARDGIIPGVTKLHYEEIIKEVMPKKLQEANLTLFSSIINS
jgi:indolepyruvate ferredoxin oxidoreductase, beta subunit